MIGASETRTSVRCHLCVSTGVWSCGTGCPLPGPGRFTDDVIAYAVEPAEPKLTPPKESLRSFAWRLLMRDQDAEAISPKRGKGPGEPVKRVRYRDKWTTRACSLASRWAVIA